MSTGRWNDGGSGDWSTPNTNPLSSQDSSPFGGPAQPWEPSRSSGPQVGGAGLAPPIGAHEEPLAPGRPPIVLLIIAAVLGAAGQAVGLLVGPSRLSIIGWLMAGPIALTVVALFSFRDTAIRGRGLYLESGAAKALYVLALLLAFGGIGVCAVQFALWVGRL